VRLNDIKGTAQSDAGDTLDEISKGKWGGSQHKYNPVAYQALHTHFSIAKSDIGWSGGIAFYFALNENTGMVDSYIYDIANSRPKESSDYMWKLGGRLPGQPAYPGPQLPERYKKKK
jgi:hypothetical protein